MSLFNELKRRNVFRVAIAYLAAAWLLVEVTDTIFPYFNLGDTAVRILIILLTIGFPLFLVFSWVFEFTPEGVKLERDVRREEAITRKTGKRLDRVIIMLLILAVGYFAVDKFVFEPTRVAEIVEETAQQARSEAMLESYGNKSIAVLPFVDMSPKGDQEYFSDGISEELLNLLAKIPELRVIARTSSFSYKSKDISIPELARELNVDHVLEGSVRKAGDLVRVSAQLIDASTDTQVWSVTFDRELKNIFDVQDEIAATVVSQLKIKLVDKVREVQKTNAVAYDLYLRAKFIAQARTPDSIQKSITLIEEALTYDPLFAQGYGTLATLHFLQRAYGQVMTTEHKDELFDLAERYANQALRLDENLPEPYAILAVRAMYRHQWKLAEENFKKAINAGPSNSQVRRWYSRQLMWLGYLEEAFDEARIAQSLDPVNPSSNANLGLVFALKGDDAQAKKYARIGRELGLVYFYTPDLIVDLENGRFADASSAWTKGLEAAGDDSEIVFKTFEALENPDLISSTLEYVESLGPHYGPAMELDLVLLLLEQYEELLDMVDGDGFMTLWTSLARPVRQLPIFGAFVSKTGMRDFWEIRGWPDLCHATETYLVCD